MSRPGSGDGTGDPFRLARFVEAQGPVWEAVRAELAAGAKRSHWMWFVFPQIAGLGHSAMAQRYALGSLEEARAYFGHPILGPRLLEGTRLVLTHAGRPIGDILPFPDDLKLKSSMTLFREAAPEWPEFQDCLATFFDGEADRATIDILAQDAR